MPDARACCIVLFVKIRYVNLKTILDLRLVYSGDKQLAWVWHDNLVLFVKGMKRQKPLIIKEANSWYCMFDLNQLNTRIVFVYCLCSNIPPSLSEKDNT